MSTVVDGILVDRVTKWMWMDSRLLCEYFGNLDNRDPCQHLWLQHLNGRFSRPFRCERFVFRPDTFEAVFANGDYVVCVHGWSETRVWTFKVTATQEPERSCWCF